MESLRGHTRLAVDRFELGDIAGARRATDAAERAADRLDHPLYQWRGVAFAATRASWVRNRRSCASCRSRGWPET